MVIRGVAVMNRMAEPSRAGETDLLAPVLAERFEVRHITAPGTLEGGDVLNAGETLIVGESDRTNVEGIAQLRALVEPLRVFVLSTPVREYLHLLTAVTYIGNNLIVVHEDFSGEPLLRGFSKVIVPRAEAYAANTLGIRECVIVPAGHSRTEEQLRALGLTVLRVPMSEFYKADGGVSCLSLVW
jgi:dimethylargininase